MSPEARAVLRDLALDVVARWDGGAIGRGRFALLAPLTGVLAAAAVEDVSAAVGPFDLTGRALTAAAMTALYLNVAAKRVRDLRLGGWPATLALHAAVAAGALAPGLFAVLLIAAATVLFLAPGASAPKPPGRR